MLHIFNCESRTEHGKEIHLTSQHFVKHQNTHINQNAHLTSPSPTSALPSPFLPPSPPLIPSLLLLGLRPILLTPLQLFRLLIRTPCFIRMPSRTRILLRSLVCHHALTVCARLVRIPVPSIAGCYCRGVAAAVGPDVDLFVAHFVVLFGEMGIDWCYGVGCWWLSGRREGGETELEGQIYSGESRWV